ncbi:MAG: cytochrome P450 [Planctomycetia bacterium]|nr:cytochrome P450 [Planctomycetia bacterium]
MPKNPPGPRDGLLGLTLGLRFRAWPLEFITEMGRRYGDLTYFRMGVYRAYIVKHPQLVREVLVGTEKTFRKLPRPIEAIREIDGNGIILSEGEYWRRQRKLLQPAFYADRLARYSAVVVDYARQMLDGWQDRTTINVADEMTHLACAIITKTLFDYDLRDQADELREALAVLSSTYIREMWDLVRLPQWLPTPRNLRKWRAIGTLDDVIRRIVAQRRADSDPPDDVLTMLLAAMEPGGSAEPLTEKQVRDEVMNLFNAGHDATAAVLAWTWYLVATHPDVEQRLLAEVDEVLGDRTATWDDVPRLRYTDMVINECLRLLPALWSVFPRQATVDTELGGYRVPKGSWIYVFPYLTQRDPRFFPDPERFDPERFAPGRVESIPPYAFFPFSGGTHMCMGNTFAMMEMKLITATVLQRFRISLAPGHPPVEPEVHIAMRPKGGLHVELSRRRQPALVETRE